MNSEDIDKIFKDTLEDKIVSFDAAAWDKVSPVLKRKKRKKIGFWLGGISLIILLLCFSFQSFLFSSKSNATANSESKAKALRNKETTALTRNKEVQSIQDTNNITIDKSDFNTETLQTKTIHTTDKNVKVFTNNKTIPVFDLSKTKSTSPSNNSKTEKINIDKFETSSTNPIERMDKDISSPKTPTEVKDLTNKIAAKNNLQIDGLANLQRSNLTNNDKTLIFRSQKRKLSFLKLTPWVTKIIPLLRCQKIQILEKKIFWSLGIYSGAGHIVNNSLHEITQNAYTLKLKGVRSQLAGLNLKAEYRRIGLNLGLEHQKYFFTESLQQEQEALTIDTIFKLVSKTKIINGENYWVIDESYDTSRSTFTKQHLDNKETSVSYLQLPVELSYRFQVLRKLSLIPSIGTRINIPLSISGFKLNNNKLENASTKTMSSNMNLFAGLQVSYQIRPRLMVGFQNRYIHQERLSNTLNQGVKKGSIINALTLNYLLF